MRYVLINQKDRVMVNAVTEDPLAFVAEFEPIDVVGKLTAWAEDGSVYGFTGEKDMQDSSHHTALVSVGHWDYEGGGPRMAKIGEGQQAKLADMLRLYLNHKPTKGGFLRIVRKEKETAFNEFDTADLTKLIDAVSLSIRG